jgi:tetratricopeptide (TPR) repeat protein
LGQKLQRRKLSRQAIAWIESGKNTDLETIADIAATLGVGVGALTREIELVQSPSATSRPPKSSPASPADEITEEPQRLVDELLAAPPSAWLTVIMRDPRYRSTAVLSALLEKADVIVDDSPTHSRDISKLASQLAEVINDSSPLADPELRVRAWKDLAWVTSRLGDHLEAFQYLEIAESVASVCSDPAHQRAIVEFVRAIVLTNMERYAEAREHLLAARVVLETVDRRRYLLTFHHEAVIQAVTQDPRAAALAIESLIEEISSWGDEADIERLYVTAAYAWHRAGETPIAAEYVHKAAEINTRKGNAAEMARDIASQAALMAAQGDPAGAFPKFDEARAKLLALGLKRDLLILDFAYLRAKAAAGAEPRELHVLCTRLAEQASAAGLPVTTWEAIDWLRQISERLTAEDVTRVEALVRNQMSVPLTFDLMQG